jgi:hypothetical protein
MGAVSDLGQTLIGLQVNCKPDGEGPTEKDPKMLKTEPLQTAILDAVS